MQEQVYKTKVSDMEKLLQRIQIVWNQLDRQSSAEVAYSSAGLCD